MKPDSYNPSPPSVSVEEALRLFEICNGPEIVEEACEIKLFSVASPSVVIVPIPVISPVLDISQSDVFIAPKLPPSPSVNSPSTVSVEEARSIPVM